MVGKLPCACAAKTRFTEVTSRAHPMDTTIDEPSPIVLQVNSPDRVWIQLAEYPEHDLEALSIAVTTSDCEQRRGQSNYPGLIINFYYLRH